MAEGTIEVDVPVRAAYAAWSEPEGFPRFMGTVERVERLDAQSLHWVEQIAGERHEWNAVISDEQPGERVSWRSVDGGPRRAGTVTFEPLGDRRTRVAFQLTMDSEAGDDRGDTSAGGVQARVEQDLRAFKHLVEGHPFARTELEGALPPGESLQGMDQPGPGGGP